MQESAARNLLETLKATPFLGMQGSDSKPCILDDAADDDWDRDGNLWGVGWCEQYGFVLISWVGDGYSWIAPNGEEFDPYEKL